MITRKTKGLFLTVILHAAGIGPNMLLARIATGYGKPNGQFKVASGAEALKFLGDLPVSELPGEPHPFSSFLDPTNLFLLSHCLQR